MRSIRLLAASATAAAVSLGVAAAPALAARPARAAAHLSVSGTFAVSHRAVALPGRAITVTGRVAGVAPGERLTLVATLGRRRIAVERVHLHAARGRRSGRIVATVTAPGAGALRLALYHRADRRLGRVHATAVVPVIAESTTDQDWVRLVQRLLAGRHLYLPQSGRWDLQTELALDAYHRLIGRAPSTTLDPATLTALLDGRGAFAVRFPGHGRHVEGDLGTQLLALVDGSKVDAIYPISSGKPSTPTILGDYRIYRRTPGYLPDGMYYSDFFIRGYAVHGYDPAPDYPASHGCMRLPISDAIPVYDWLALGDWVDVYR